MAPAQHTSHENAKPELLAPAGDFICLQAAIQGGADAVFFGVGDLNMRAGSARNFTADDLPEIRTRTNEAGMKAYLTLNTMLLPDELANAERLLDAAAGQVDAVIVWDPAVIARCWAKGIPFHISTQASVANPDTAAFYRDLGARRIVLARECSLPDIRKIRQDAGVAVEVFVHGAMCVSVSGRCFLSQDVFGASGNRGKCLQNCRRNYVIKDCEDGTELELGEDYVLSAKDLCTLPFLDLILDAGVDALKIEGRGRNPEYVQTVCRAYRTAIDAWRAGGLTQELKDRLVDDVGAVFHRGFSSGFYMGVPVNEFSRTYGGTATARKDLVGIVENHYPKAKAVSIRVQSHTFSIGDTLMIQGPTTGVVTFPVTGIREEEQPLQTAPRGLVTVPLTEKVRLHDRVYVVRDAAAVPQITAKEST